MTYENKLEASPKGDNTKGDGKKNAISEKQVRQESSKAASSALAAQRKAKELRDAASAAGDPDEREKLTKEAVNKEIEAESFGKTAKYLRTGTFQGLAMGTGLGVAPSATLGALTGTLVGGVSSLILGGVGGGIGAVAGAAHGPFVNFGEQAGKGVKKLTSKLPGWVASKEQKQTLEKMVGQVHDQDMPGEEDLKRLQEDSGGSGGGEVAEGWMKSAGQAGKSVGNMMGQGGSRGEKQLSSSEKPKMTSGNAGERKKPRKLEMRSERSGSSTPGQSQSESTLGKQSRSEAEEPETSNESVQNEVEGNVSTDKPQKLKKRCESQALKDRIQLLEDTLKEHGIDVPADKPPNTKTNF